MTNDNRFEEAYNTTTDSLKGGARNMCEVLDKVENRGKSEGKNQMALLVKHLLDQGRIDDVKRVSEDAAYRDELMKKLGIH